MFGVRSQLVLISRVFFRTTETQEIGEESESAEREKETMRRLEDEYRSSWRRIMLLILAVTVHNIPEVNYRCSIAFTISYWLSVYQLSLGTRRWCRIRLCGKDRSSQVRNSFQSGNRNWSSELPRRASGFTATGCLWSFQTEGEHTSVSKKKIVKRMIKAYTPHR